MKIDDILYFAPGIRFDQLDFDAPELPRQFASRIVGFYLDPAAHCIRANFAFAAGVLLTASIDALARMQSENEGGGKRFISFACRALPSFTSERLAERLYLDFRNGLVHEGRIKKGAQFSFDVPETVQESEGILVINPERLAVEVRRALDRYVSQLHHDPALRRQFSTKLKANHADDR